MWYRTIVWATAAAAAIGAAPAVAQTVTMDLQSLEGVGGVLLVVDGVTADAETDGLSADSLRADLAAMLRRAGIPTLTEPEWQQAIGNPALILRLKLIKPSPHLYLYSGTLELKQLTVLARDSTKAAFAPTWAARDLLGTKPTGALPTLRGEVYPLIRQFISDYLDAAARTTRDPRGKRPRSASRARATDD